MRYQVPQFIEIEDKVVGPLTIKQAIYLTGGMGMSFIVYNYLYIYIALPIIAAIVALSLALAFYKVNNKPFVDFLESVFGYYTKNRLYIWKKEDKPLPPEKIEERKIEQLFVPRMSQSKLKELAWSLDINENSNPLTGDDGRTTR